MWWQEISGFHHLHGALCPRGNPLEHLCFRNARALVPPALPWPPYSLRPGQTLSDQTIPALSGHLVDRESEQWMWLCCPTDNLGPFSNTCWRTPQLCLDKQRGKVNALHPALHVLPGGGDPSDSPHRALCMHFIPVSQHTATPSRSSTQMFRRREWEREFTAPAVIALPIYAFSLLSPSSFVVLWTAFNLFNRLPQ